MKESGELISKDLSQMDWRFILGEIRKGHGAGRAMLHLKVKTEFNAQGIVLDIGGGRRQSYLKFMDLSKSVSFVSLDLEFVEPPTFSSFAVMGSVTNLPVASDSIGTVLCFNLLEHVFDHRTAIAEIHRVMTEGGVLYGWVPFLFAVHGAPHDYWRYTDLTMIELLSSAGFKQVRAENTGSLFLSIFDLLSPYYRFKFVRVPFGALALMATWAVSKIAKRKGSVRPFDGPSGVWFIATR